MIYKIETLEGLGVVGLADVEWESVPRFGSCNAEVSLAKFKKSICNCYL